MLFFYNLVITLVILQGVTRVTDSVMYVVDHDLPNRQRD